MQIRLSPTGPLGPESAIKRTAGRLKPKETDSATRLSRPHPLESETGTRAPFRCEIDKGIASRDQRIKARNSKEAAER
jgi:hypothetical protein